MSPPPHQQGNLWFSAGGLDALAARAQEDWFAPARRVCVELADRALDDLYAELRDESGELGRHLAVPVLEACIVAWLATGKQMYGEKAYTLWEAVRDYTNDSDLGRAALAMNTTIISQFLRPVWSGEQNAEVLRYLRDIAVALQEVRQGNPDNPFNNWYGVTHSAAGLAALAARETFPEMNELLALEKERIRSYLCNYSETGYYYEGTGYGGYAFSQWGPFVLAVRHTEGEDLGDVSPGISGMLATTLMMTTARAYVSDVDSTEPEPPRVGMRINWNDSGNGAMGVGLTLLMMAFAPANEIAAARSMFDQLFGKQGDNSWLETGRFFPQLFTLCYYPSTTAPQRPDAVFPRTLLDKRAGLALFRNRYKDGDDCVLGVYARTYHGGGHKHDDLGSWRLQGLGGGWSQAGGQAKPKGHYNCTILKNGAIWSKENKGQSKQGQISYYAPQPDGSGTIALRLGRCYAATLVDRYFAVDYSGRSGAAATLANYDVLWDEAEVEWTWSLCYERNLLYAADDDGRGFTLRHPEDDAHLRARFVLPAEDFTLTHHPGEKSERTFSNGRHVAYHPAPYITATRRAARTAFFVVMTLQRDEAPAVTASGEGLDTVATVGGAKVWMQRGRWFEGPLRIGDAG